MNDLLIHYQQSTETVESLISARDMQRDDTEALVGEVESGPMQEPRSLNPAEVSSSSNKEASPPPRHDHRSYRWFILEPAVFLIFFARYLIGT